MGGNIQGVAHWQNQNYIVLSYRKPNETYGPKIPDDNHNHHGQLAILALTPLMSIQI